MFDTLPPHSPCVVCVDDSLTVRKILETCLRREGFVVYSFPDGVQMLRWLTGPEGRIPNLVILDICLPKLDGYTVAQRLRAKRQFANSIIIMLSRRDSMIDRLKGRLAGASVYLSKPFKTREIVAVVKTQLGITPRDEQDVFMPSTLNG